MDLSFLTSIDLLFYIVLGLGVLFGILRGMKKTLFTFVTMAIFYVFFFVTIDAAVQFLWTLDLPWIANIMPQLAGFTSFSDSLELIANTFLGDQVDIAGLNPQVMVLASGLVMFVLKIVYTILYFTVILLVYKILMAIIYAIFFHSKNKDASKNRGFGALFGALNGLMAVFIMLIMLGGIMSIVESMTTFIESATGNLTQVSMEPRDQYYEAEYSVIPLSDTTLPDTTQALELLQQLIDNYNANIFVQLANTITTTEDGSTVEVPLHLSLFDSVLSFDLNDQPISIRYELSVYAEAATVILDSEYMNTQVISDITGDEIRQIFTILSESNLLVSLLPMAIEVAADQYNYDLNISTDELYAIDYQSELAQLGVVAGTVFDILNGAGIISGEGGAEDITVDGDLVRGLFGDISQLNLAVLLTSAILVPMLEDPQSDLSLIITVPDDINWENEFVAIGDVIGEVLDSGITIADLQEGDPNVLFDAVSKIDFTVLMDSQLITNALINILSGRAQIEGLDVLVVPNDIVWLDTVDEFGNVLVQGELHSILAAISALAGVLPNLDINNLGLDTISVLTDDVIDSIFESRILVATISSVLLSQNIADTPLVIPDSVFDGDGYLTKVELKALAKSISLIANSGLTEGFDVAQVLSLTSDNIDILLGSQIISATIGNMLYGMDGDLIQVPLDAIDQVEVNSVLVSVVSSVEIKNAILALAVLNISNFDSIAFDASIFSSLEEEVLVGDPTQLDDAKLDTLLNSKIIHASVSKMLIDLGPSGSDVLSLPSFDENSQPLITTSLGTEYVAKSEIKALLQGLYALNINDFSSISLDNTAMFLDHIDVLLESSLIQATISDLVISLAPTISVPQSDQDGNAIIISTADQDYISKTELQNFFNALDLLGMSSPDSFSSSFDLTILVNDADKDTLLSSAILHATMSKTILDLGSSVIQVPSFEEDGTTAVKIVQGSTTYISKTEFKHLLNGILAMGFTNTGSFGSQISSTVLFDSIDTVILSACLQATISEQLLSVTSGTLIIPDKNALNEDIRIVQADVTYISQAEILAIVDALELLGLTNLSTFDITPATIFAVDFNDLLASATMQATISDYILENALDESAPAGSGLLIVPEFFKEVILVDGVSADQIEKTELIALLDSIKMLNLSTFGSSFDASVITSMTPEQIDTFLTSGSIHVTIDNMLKGNANISSQIPDLAEADVYDMSSIVTKAEIKAFILATNTLGGGASFTNVNFNYTTISSMSAGDRDIVLDSMIVRNILTDQLEAMMLLDDPFDPYWPANNLYMNNDPLTFLTEAGINDVFTHYGFI